MRKSDTKERPLISIIIPVYNVEPYLKRCLDSVAAQTYTNLEIILVDDASTDASGSVCDLYAAGDERIQVIHLPVNQGVSHARNVGLDKAGGQFTGFVDPDDWVETKLYERLYQSLVENQADISVCGVERKGFKYGNVKQTDVVQVVPASQAVYNIIQGTWGGYAVYNKLFSGELIKKCRFLEKVTRGEDLLFLYKILRYSRCVSYTPEQLYHYIYREDSAMHGKFDIRQYTQFQVYQSIYPDVRINYPELVPRIECQILDVNIKMAVNAVESGTVKGRRLYDYLQKFHRNIRKYISKEAMRLIVYKKIAAEILLLNFSVELFWGIIVLYKKIKKLLKIAEEG